MSRWHQKSKVMFTPINQNLFTLVTAKIIDSSHMHEHWRINGGYLSQSSSADERCSMRKRKTQDSDALKGDIVMMPPVKEARDKGLLTTKPMFDRLTEQGVVWSDGTEESIDAIIWCTGFNPELEHLAPLDVIE